MLYYCEFKDAIDRGFINQDTIMTSRINGQLHDYILEGEPIKPHEIITIEKVSDVLKELETWWSSEYNFFFFPNRKKL